MVRPDYLSDDAALVLAWLWELDARAGGYTRRGVRGWARRENVEAGTKLDVPELLSRLRGRGLVQEEHAHLSGTRPVMLYRITSLGDLLLARRQLREARPPWPAGDLGEEDAAVYLPPGASLALRLLREAKATAKPSRFPDVGVGWRNEDELRDQLLPPTNGWEGPGSGPWLPGDLPWQRYTADPDAVDQPDPPVGFDTVDLAWLERAGLVRRTHVLPPKRKRPLTLWQITVAGQELEELTWHEPQNPHL